jgi:hypothetical protein
LSQQRAQVLVLLESNDDDCVTSGEPLSKVGGAFLAPVLGDIYFNLHGKSRSGLQSALLEIAL